MTGKLYKTLIKERTEEYWEQHKDDYGCYVEELIGRELTCAHNHRLDDRTPRLRPLDKPVHTLALTVGESFEPLLQVTCVLRPKRVVLILNSFYGGTPGRDHGNSLKRLMVKLANAPGLPDDLRPSLREGDFDLKELDADTPTHVFRALRDAMQKPEAQPKEGFVNAVDITGAKKSMVVGAFLYAAHSGLPITYVDFDEYSSDWGRPYGYTCKIGQIRNPYEAFRLREWEQVRQLYNSYNFRGARTLLGKARDGDEPGSGIIGAMSDTLDSFEKDKSLYEESDIEKAKRLAQAMEMYEAWENGDYVRAKTLLDGFVPSLPPDTAPLGITELGGDWPSASAITDPTDAAKCLLTAHLDLKQGEPDPSDSIFGKPSLLLAYVRDEIAKIERLSIKNEDYRSAFLRAAGLEEFLLKARLCLCWLNGKLEVVVDKKLPVLSVKLNSEDHRRGFRVVVGHSGGDGMRDTLRRKKELSLTLQKRGDVQVSLSVCAPQLGEYWKHKALDFDVFLSDRGNPGFTRLRGEAIHTHLYIPKHVAEAAIELVRAAVDEFEVNWLNCFHPEVLHQAEGKSVEAPPWRRLYEVFDLGFLPPKLRE